MIVEVKQVKTDTVNGVQVQTVRVTNNHNQKESYETILSTIFSCFSKSKTIADYSTLQEALKGHTHIVKALTFIKKNQSTC